MNPRYTIIVLVLLVVAAGGGYLLYVNKSASDQGMVACTAEALICPDGTMLGRNGPNCEFDKCPLPPLPPDTNSTSTSSGSTATSSN